MVVSHATFILLGAGILEPLEAAEEVAEWAADASYVLESAQQSVKRFGGGIARDKNALDLAEPE